MWKNFFAFDIRYLARRPTLWAVTGLFTALMGATYWLPAHLLKVFGASVLAAPVNAAVLLGMLGLLGTFVLTGLLADTVIRDGEANSMQLLMAAPVRAADLLTGRLLAGFVCSLLAYAGAAVALVIAAARTTPLMGLPEIIQNVALPFALLVVPNAFMLAVFVVAVACKTRSLTSVYGSVFAFYVLWALSAFPIFPVDEATRFQISALMDPFGTRALLVAVKGLSTAQLDHAMPMAKLGLLFINRGLWLVVSGAVFMWTALRFAPLARKEQTKKAKASKSTTPLAKSLLAPAFTASTAWRQALALVLFDGKQLYRSVALRIIASAGVMLVGAALFDMSGLYGSRGALTTAAVLAALQDNIAVPLTVLAIVLATELMGKAKASHMAEMTEALPVPAWVRWISALTTLTLALWAVALVFSAIGWLAQQSELTIGGDSSAWLAWAQMQAMSAFMLAALALAVQSLCRERAVGYAVYGTFFAISTTVAHLDPEQAHWVYAQLPAIAYSDLMDMSTALAAWKQVALGWAGVGLLLVLLAYCVRPVMQASASRRVNAAALLVATGFAYFAVGAWLQPPAGPSKDTLEQLQARYEKNYSRYQSVPQPRLTAVTLDAAFEPAAKKARLTGNYLLVNKTTQALKQLHVTVNPFVDTKLTVPGAHLSASDAVAGYQVWDFTQQLEPGAEVRMAFDIQLKEGQVENPVNEGVTVFNNHEYLPQMGYLTRTELTDAAARARQGLGVRAASVRLSDSHMEGNADWVSFQAVLSTVQGQVALTSGDLQRTWSANGRSFFEYRAEKMLPYFAVVSGAFEKKSARADGVELTAYVHKDHAGNVAPLLEAARKSVNSYQKQFGAYPHKELKLVEVPSRLRGAQSFPGMVTLFESSELNRHSMSEQDPLLFLVSHEVAHQWWGHQVVGAKAPGAELLSESMAQYSALTVIKQVNGQAAFDKALTYERERFDGRRKDGVEPALLDVGYERVITYHKGALVLAQLSKDLGDKQFRQMLAEFYERYRYATPYPTSRDFLHHLCSAATPAQCANATQMLGARGDLPPAPTRSASVAP